MHLRGYVVLLLVGLVLFAYRSFVLYNYDQAEYLRRPDIRTVIDALKEGRSGDARQQALKLHRNDWYSGIPAAVVAATYYQDYARGDEKALNSMEEYLSDSQDRELSFVGLYYLALLSFHRQRYEAAGDQLKQSNELLLRSHGIWRRQLDTRSWHRCMNELEAAIKKAKAGETPQRAILFPRPNVAHPDRFEVLFKL